MQNNKPVVITYLFAFALIFLLLLVIGYFGFRYADDIRSFISPDPELTIEESVQLQKFEHMISSMQEEGTPIGSNTSTESVYNLGHKTILNENPAGYLVFTGRTPDIQNEVSLKAFYLDLSDESQTPQLLLPEMAHFNGLIEYINKDDASRFILLSTSTIEEDSPSDGKAIHYWKNSRDQLFPYQVGGLNERNFKVSEEASLVAFNRTIPGKSGKYVDMIDIDSWQMVVFKPGTQSVLYTVDGAWDPQWLPGSGRLIYLRSGGLYEFIASSSEERLLVPVESNHKVVTTSMIDLSPDNNFLAWTTAKKGIITFYKMGFDVDVVSLEKYGETYLEDTEIYWPQWSPDSKFLAVQLISVLGEDAMFRDYPRLAIYPFDSNFPVYERSMTDFSFNHLFTDDWISVPPMGSVN